DRAYRVGETPPDAAVELVWELLMIYGETRGEVLRAAEDIEKTAYELATMVLASLPPKRALLIYRDFLLDAMLEHHSLSPLHEEMGGETVDKVRANLVRFANKISDGFCEAHSDLLRRTIRHQRAEKLANDLRLAKRIQMHLLPKIIPNIPGFEFAGRLIPAEEIGGDYWSVKHKADTGIVTLKLADVAGHGLAAATLVAAVKFISGGFYQGSSSAAEVMKKTNRVLTIETPRDILVTMVYGWLKPELFELTLVNAGHSPVFVCKRGSCTDIPPTGPVLGVVEDADYEEYRLNLQNGDIVFFGSDGITEAGTVEPFGADRVKHVVTENAHLSADEIAERVVSAVTEYAYKPHDDVSLLIIKVTSEPS
ncbi:MAG: SpoIIE family protein phosphatase, partial [Armatimonadetes bacterium]|nr:SpoIIE family protein phosphatase [Armatimonadota bacterium]